MKIAQVAPLYERTPPTTYGGTERVVSNLTEELVKKGHQVTLFATGDSITTAELVPVCEKSIRSNPLCTDPLFYHVMQLQMVQERVSEFDIIHYHTDFLHFPLSRRSGYKNHVTTLHGFLGLHDLSSIYRIFPDMPVISISNNQRLPLADACWEGTVYHGLPAHLHSFHPAKGTYLAFIGRISPEKRVDRAITIAQKTGIPLKIAAKIDKADQQYYEEEIQQLMDDPLVEYVGEITDQEKSAFLGNALAMLFPIDWSEPFGMVLIESMACGTPIIAFEKGSVPEIVDHGETGFMVHSTDEAISAVNYIDLISRKRCREIFEERFTASVMAENYLKIYRKIVGRKENDKLITVPKTHI